MPSHPTLRLYSRGVFTMLCIRSGRCYLAGAGAHHLTCELRRCQSWLSSPMLLSMGGKINSAQGDIIINESERGMLDLKSLQKYMLITKDFMTLLHATQLQTATQIPERPFDRLFWTGFTTKVRTCWCRQDGESLSHSLVGWWGSLQLCCSPLQGGRDTEEDPCWRWYHLEWKRRPLAIYSDTSAHSCPWAH
jgi:hypothetical protein